MEAILFDLDGTIVDSRKGVVQAVYETAEGINPGQYTYETLNEQFGVDYEKMLVSMSPENKEEILATLAQIVNRTYIEEVTSFPFVKEGLLDLYERGYLLAIVTNQNRRLTKTILQKLDMYHLFTHIVTIDDVTVGKPAAEPILAAISKLNIVKEQSIMVGDSIYDVEAAQKAGVTSVRLENGVNGVRDIKADYTYKTFKCFIDRFLHKNIRRI